MSYNRINNITGWLVFAVAAYTYISTMEPTASFWDCGEFISTSYRLGIPHPPGAPVFLLIGRMFSLIAGNNVTEIAYWINMVSALSSAFTSLFLFWSITLLGRKLLKPKNGGSEYDLGEILAIMGAGIIGSVAYTFSDSAWFSAVEAEVYAMSSFFTAIVFWAILKWESKADEPGADRWLIFIAYLVGLSIGVHLLNLVALPAIGLVYYFKRYHNKVTGLGIGLTLLVSFVIIGFIMAGVITGLPTIAAYFEILFVNKFHLPFDSGSIFFIVLIVGALTWGIWASYKAKAYAVNVVLTSIAFIMIGYYSYGVIVIRSQFNPTIDMNNPENVVTFTSYLKREQYGDRPLLKGPLYTVALAGVRPEYKTGAPIYTKFDGDKKYTITSYKTEVKYDSRYTVLFPRMYSTDPDHIRAYQEWMGLGPEERPGFTDNIGFMLKYQMGHMYWRYFAWNFIGRAGDQQDAGTIWPQEWFQKVKPEGKELAALSAEEKAKVMNSSSLVPSEIAHNKARNNFYMLPFLAGVIGLYWQFAKNSRDFSIVALFFFFTGLAIIIYLNQPPVEPRERDYTFAASFYAYSIWIGFAVLFLYDVISRAISSTVTSAVIATVACLVVPGIMGAQGWDDHDRSKRYFQIDAAKNLLASCDSNAILFTGGDNDTYPLWYVQEVEGFRTDVRVCNTSLLNTDWYIDQMKRPSYASAPLPISLSTRDYVNGVNDYIYFDEENKVANAQKYPKMSIPVYLKMVKAKSPVITEMGQRGMSYTLFPSKNWFIPIDTATALRNISVPEGYEKFLANRIEWTFSGNGFDKCSLIILDMIVNNNWERPIYFSSTVDDNSMVGLSAYMQTEGLAQRLMPFKVPQATSGWVNPDLMYKKMMNNNFQFRNLSDSTIFYDENYLRFTFNCRMHYVILAGQLLNAGEEAKALEVLDYSLKVMPDHTIRYDRASADMIDLYFRLGKPDKAMAMANTMAMRAHDMLLYTTGKSSYSKGYYFKNYGNLMILEKISRAMLKNGKITEGQLYREWYTSYGKMLGFLSE